jgi:hypothetical protein
MQRLDWFLAFSQITFPVFLLIPTIITAYKVYIPVEQIIRFFVILWWYFQLISIVSLFLAGLAGEGGIFIFLLISIVLVGWALVYVTVWTVHEQVRIEDNL